MKQNRMKAYLAPLIFLYRKLRQVYLPVFLFSGKTRKNQIPVAFAYVGKNPAHQNFWSNLIMDAPIHKTFIGNHFLCRITCFLKQFHPQCSMILWEKTPFSSVYLKDKPALKIPKWIRMEIDISAPMEEMTKKKYTNYKRIQRRIRHHGYQYSVTRDLSAFKDFYANFYLPYIQARYPGDHIVLPFSEMYNGSVPMDLFLIKKGAIAVAGAFVKYRSGKAILSWFGVLHGNFEHVREGALGAAYYFVVLEMQKKGFTKLNIGDSRPVMNNGPTWHKIRLSARIDDSDPVDPRENLFLILLNDTKGLRDFLENNHLIYIEENEKLVSTSWVGPQPFSSPDDFKLMAMLSNRSGFDSHHVFLFEHSEIPKEWFEMDHKRHVVIKQTVDVFL